MVPSWCKVPWQLCLIERIDSYNTPYNKLYDLDGGGVDQTAKRFLENSDPQVGYKMVTAPNDRLAGTRINKCDADTPNDNKSKFMVNNWPGFLSTCSCPCPDSNHLNNLEIEITFDNEKVLWSAGVATATGVGPGLVIPSDGASYKLEDVIFTICKMIFDDPLCYNLKASKMLSSGLQINYQT